MTNLIHNENKRLTTLISGGYLLLVSVLAIVFLNGAPATTAQADSHCGEDVCQNESAQFTINMQVEEGTIDSFEVEPDAVYLGQEITLDWNTTDAQDVAACGGPSPWSGSKSLNGSEDLNAPSSSGDGYTYELCTYDINGNETARDSDSIDVLVRTPVIDDFDSNKDEVEEGETFNLSWGTTNAGDVEASPASGHSNGQDGRWSGSLSSDGTIYGISEATANTYTYGLRAYDAEGNNPVEKTLQITVVEPPRFDINFNSSPTDIDGEPGSTAEIDVVLTPENEYDGEIEVSVTDVSPSMGTPSGDKFEFRFPPESGGNSTTVTDDSDPATNDSGSVTIEVETMQAIRSDTPYEVTVEAVDTTGTADPRVQTADFTLNAEGFSPRTIEEF